MTPLSLVTALFIVSTAVAAPDKLPEGAGLAAKYPGDVNISRDTSVLFSDDFESGDLKKWDDKSGSITVTDEKPNAGAKCAAAPMEKGKNNGGEAKKWFLP